MKPIWKGSISFGLVTFPISLYSAVQDRSLSFHLFHKKDKSPIKYARICEKENKEVPWEDIIKGYEVKKGKYVFLEEEDFEKANVEKSSSIDIIGFLPEAEIDLIFYDKPYYLAPQKNGSKAYFLLAEALHNADLVGLCRFVLRHHEYLGAIKPEGEYLILEQLHYLEDFRKISDLPIPNPPKRSEKEVNMALTLMEEMRIPFEPEKYYDSYVDDLKEVIEAKAKAKKLRKKARQRRVQNQRNYLTFFLKASRKEKEKQLKLFELPNVFLSVW